MNRKVSIFSISPDGEKTYYPSMKEAAAAVGVSLTTIGRAVHFGYTAAGMSWERAEPEEDRRVAVKLKPCPFCGMIPEVEKYIDRYNRTKYGIECKSSKCDIQPTTPWYAEEKEAVKAWDRRPNDVYKERDELRADNKRLNEAYETMSRDIAWLSQQLAEAQRKLEEK